MSDIQLANQLKECNCDRGHKIDCTLFPNKKEDYELLSGIKNISRHDLEKNGIYRVLEIVSIETKSKYKRLPNYVVSVKHTTYTMIPKWIWYDPFINDKPIIDLAGRVKSSYLNLIKQGSNCPGQIKKAKIINVTFL